MDFQNRYLKRNFLLNTMDGISYFAGMIFIAPESILPVYIERLGGGAFIIALIPVLRNLGMFFPSLFIAAIFRPCALKNPIFWLWAYSSVSHGS